jgi:translation initiation factor 3 subunit E
MCDYAIDEHKKLNGADAVPAELEQRRDEVYTQLTEWKASVQPLLDVLSRNEEVERMMEDKKFTLEHLTVSHGITQQMLDDLHRYAKLNYECGMYKDAGDYLYYYRILNKDEEKNFSALWGKLASEILVVNWEVALADLKMLKERVDARVATSDNRQLLQQRTWIVHWALFIFFNLDQVGVVSCNRARFGAVNDYSPLLSNTHALASLSFSTIS